MTHSLVKRSIWLGIGVAVVALLVWMLRPSPLLVEVATVNRGTVRVTVSGEGRTRVKALYVVTAPVDGELERIMLEPGAQVARDAVVARIRPISSRPLDARSRAEATAAAVATRQALARAEAAEKEAEVALEHVASKLKSTQALAQSGSVPQAELLHGGHEVEIARRSLEATQAQVRQVRAELARANAVIAPISAGGSAVVVDVKSPEQGRLLRVLRESAGPVAVGAPLLELGDVLALEIVAELLSSDAATVRTGATATISGWGSGTLLAARVRRVEPAGFTKVSALGLEEQRVRVVLDLSSPAPEGLGHDYRVDAAIGVWEGKDVLRVPSTVLFRVGNDWAAFVIRDHRARRTQVVTGPSDATWTVVKSGLSAGDRVISQPSDAIVEGTRVGVLRELSTPSLTH
jgi:HlyD family secretion protein